MPPRPRPLADRFWEKVQKSDGCWMWRACIKGGRYGVIGRGAGQGTDYAHRVSWELAYGPIPDGMDICHTCDNPACVRPSHLFVGTRKDNMADMAQKGRHRNGETHKVARITAEQVREMIARLLEGAPFAEVAEAYGVSAKHVENIRYGYRWKHIERPAEWLRAS